ncbi:MAG: cyclic nucleotide-binding domain-containing protein [Elusimicrobia bacterium]|nr:cyclic nucleotide-binding domain-containing protein [Elusimicrobiota bacterium]
MTEIDGLKNIGIFKNFSAEMLEEFSGYFRQISRPAGAVIFREKSEGDTLFIIVSGEVVIEKKLDEEGKEFKPLAILTKGDFFGEMAVLEVQPRSAQARAALETSLYEIKRTEFLNFIKEHSETGINFFIEIIKVVLKRLQHTSNELTMLFDMSRVIMDEHKSVAAFMAKMVDEISIYFEGHWNINAFFYNKFNEEYDPAGSKISFDEPAVLAVQSAPKDGWLDARTYIMTCSRHGNRLGYVRFCKSADVSSYEKNNLGTIFNTISSISSSAIENIEHRVETELMLKLKNQKNFI